MTAAGATINRANEALSQLTEKTKRLSDLIEQGEWYAVLLRCKSSPEQIKGYVDPVSGATFLHYVCSQPQAPEGIISKFVELFPEATRIQENNYGATPLHVLCLNSQRSVRKVLILLKHMKPDDLLLRNRFGGTVLHSACGSHAGLHVIKAIVKANPAILLERTHDYNHTAFTALWQSHLQSIPGHMQIARILEGDDVNEDHFQRFWEKLEFLAGETFKVSGVCPDDALEDPQKYTLHGLINLRAPLNALKVAVKRNPEWARAADTKGNYPLHNIVIRRPFRVRDVELIKELLLAYPEASGQLNREGNAPLFIAIRDRMGWDDGLGELANADVEVLSSLDNESGLYPFLLAASLGGRVAVNTTYQLLCAKPYLVKAAVDSTHEEDL